MKEVKEAEICLKEYLDGYQEKHKSIQQQRVTCDRCKVSRSLYCATCLEILLPQSQWPDVVKDQELQLPFDLDIILNDRRFSSTGIQLATILEAAKSPNTIRIADLNLEDPFPTYENDDEQDGTYLLFPSPSSVPLSSILSRTDDNSSSSPPSRKIKRLVVLDCKWCRSSVRLDKNLSHLPQVHLDDPPCQSYYWRWHNSGSGMLSTIEAVYFAAWQVGELQSQWSLDQRQHLLSLFWLFGIQREIIRRQYENGVFKKEIDGTVKQLPVPFTEDGKEYQRSLRRLHPNRGKKKKKRKEKSPSAVP